MWCSLREPGQGGGEGRIRKDRVSGLKSRNLTWFCSSGSTNNKPQRTVFVVQFESLKRRMWTSMAQFLSSAGYNRLRRCMGPLTRFLVLPNVLSSDVYVTASPVWEQAGWKQLVQRFLLSSVRQAREASSGVWSVPLEDELQAHTGRLVQCCVRHRLTSLHHSPAKSQTDGP